MPGINKRPVRPGPAPDAALGARADAWPSSTPVVHQPVNAEQDKPAVDESSAISPPAHPLVARNVGHELAGARSAPLAAPGSAVPPVGNAFAAWLNTRRDAATGHEAVTASSATSAPADIAAAQGHSEVPTHLPIDALKDLSIPPSGLALQLDADSVAGQRVVLRRIVDPEQGEGLEVQLKLRHASDISRVADAMKAQGAAQEPWRAQEMHLDAEGRWVIDRNSPGAAYPAAADGKHVSAKNVLAAEALLLRLETADGGSSETRLLPDNAAQAVRGMVSVRVFGGDDEARIPSLLREALSASALAPALTDSRAETRGMMNQLRVLWQTDPQKAQEFASRPLHEPASAAEVASALQSAGIDPHEAANLPVREVFPGHFTTLRPGQGEEYRQLGVEYLFSGVRNAAAVVGIVTGDGLMSTRERYARGIIVKGASTASDMGSGGADYVFTRMVTRDAIGQSLQNAFGAGDYQLVFGTEILDRTDWFAYPQDNYGITRDLERFTHRKYGADLVSSLKSDQYFLGYALQNEVMFQTGIRSADIQQVFTGSEEKRQALIDALADAGVNEIGGLPLAKAIVVRTRMLEETTA